VKKDLLVEIGVEELPPGFIINAVKTLEKQLISRLNDNRLSHGKIDLFSTPRRLALIISDLETEQDDITKEKIGPAIEIAYDEKGKLSQAAHGFLKSSGASENDLYTIESSKGKKLAVKIYQNGQRTEKILRTVIPDSIRNISSPKTMRWVSKDLYFARPIRWLTVIFGEEPIAFEIDGIRANKFSFGNRFKALDCKIEIPYPKAYSKVLEKVYVIPERSKREQIIRTQVKDLFLGETKKCIIDKYLLAEVTDLVEYPTAVRAYYDPKYLQLPSEIVITTLSKHQKYFAVKDLKTNKLTNEFVFISNGDPDCSDLIKPGNEKVVKARLEDAEFYFREDLKVPLENYVSKLKQVTFQEKIGSLYDKTERIKTIAGSITKELMLNEQVQAHIIRAAYLCKGDLVTLMLGEKEFTKLQGYIGMEYARAGGEPEEVARAIFEHYLPRGKNDNLPGSIIGSVVAIADKIDTVCGICAAGLLPTGSNDPFALRRAGNGIIQIIVHQGFEMELLGLIEVAFNSLKSTIDISPETREFVHQFMKQRVNWILKENGIDYDIIESVMHIDYSNVVDLLHRAKDLQEFKQRDDFLKLVIGFKRVSNIIIDYHHENKPDPKLFEHETEKDLYAGYMLLEKEISNLLAGKDYAGIMKKLVEFGILIDRFFDDVLVNTDEAELRLNRYNLLTLIRALFLKVADLAKIVVEGYEK